MTKNEKKLFILSALWAALLLALGSWWAYLIVKLATGELQYDRQKLTAMIKWEGGTFLLLLVASSGTLLFFYLKDKKRTISLQAFFSSLTHEFKTPLASIKLQGEVIHDKISELPKKQSQDIQILTRRLIQDSNRLEIQMDKILQLSRLERGAPISTISFNIIEYLEKIHLDLNPPVIFHFDFKISKEQSFIEVDLFLLDLIFKNLLENTHIHSKENKVTIKLEDKNQFILLTYEDGGKFAGDTNQLGKLFYKFNSTKGSGIGLYLIKNMLKKMQGNFSVQTAHHDKGHDKILVFYLWFKKSNGEYST